MRIGKNVLKAKNLGALALIAELQIKYPKAFPTEPNAKVPLKAGLVNDIWAIRESLEVGKKTVQAAIALWCTGDSYIKALAGGGPRYDLDGNACGEVSKEQQTSAKKALKSASNE